MSLEPTMKKLVLHTAVAVAVLSAPYAAAAPIQLSEAFNYNAFIFNDFEGQYSDVEGRLAVGGEMRVNDFNVGLQLSPQLSDSALLVGKNLHFINGNVHGGSTTVSGMVFGENLSLDKGIEAEQTINLINSTVKSGNVTSEGDVKLGNSNVVSGDVHANSVVLGGPAEVYDSRTNEGMFGSKVENGNVSAESNVTLVKSEINGTVTMNSGGTLTTDGESSIGAEVRGEVKKATVENIQFSALEEEVRQFSNDFRDSDINGTTLVESSSKCFDTDGNVVDTQSQTCAAQGGTEREKVHTITFKGENDINVFDIDASTLSVADKSIWYDFTSTSYNIINVRGEVVELFNTGFFNEAYKNFSNTDYFTETGQYADNAPASSDTPERRHDGKFTNNILFNFVDATNITFHSVGIKGSVLAPYANISFYNGQVDGNLIAKNLSSPDGEFTGQVNNYRFGAIDVSEPASWALLFGAGFLMMARRKKA